jgi:chromosome segregation protein
MRLKQLELQGYKTFAAKTEFVFKGGLTAIVGPNGSGKSNISDAIQWVLGEQSYGRLRAKRSEDMIFSGSTERPRMGMAQASLTLDNIDGWLPVDYGEVVITRRAYRSGENEYLLNGSRVRLRDINDLLSQSGLAKRTYTAIGQGLIDQALSLKPDERRALIEEAAGITGYQAKRDQALRQLDETRHNLERVQDILSEIEPRLRYLKTQARRAQERLQIQADLDTQLRIWYGYRWHETLHKLEEAKRAEAEARQVVEAHQATLRQLDRQHANLRQRYAQLRHQLGDWHRESSVLHRRAETVQRELAVGAERLRQLGERHDELVQELGPLEERLVAQQAQVTDAEANLDQERTKLTQLESQIREVQARVDAVERQRSDQQRKLNAIRHNVGHLQSQLTSEERRLLEHESRQQALAEERQRLQEGLEAVRASHEDLTPQLAAFEERATSLEERKQSLLGQREALRGAIQETEVNLNRINDRLAVSQRTADRLQDQFDLLQRLKDEGEGYSGGTRSILRLLGSDRRGTASEGVLSGIIGTVADQLRVPSRLELAVETALGGRLQDLVVERWEDAQQAIAWLKDTGSGRTTFLPLDTIRPGRPVSAPAWPGVVGVAADLVEAEPRLRRLVAYLLGRVVITEDLATARRVLDSGSERPTVVTLDGDIVRPGGSVSGGSRQTRRDRSVLARERALRELPQQLGEAQQAVHSLQRERQSVLDQLAQERDQVADFDTQVERLAGQAQEIQSALAKVQGQVDQIARELAWREERRTGAEREQAALAAQAQQARQRQQELVQSIEESQLEEAAARQGLAELEASDLAASLMELQTQASIVATRVTSHQDLVEGQRRSLAQLQRQAADKQERAQMLAEERVTLAQRLEEMQAREVELASQIEAFGNRIEPAEAELTAMDEERSQLAAQEAEHRSQLQSEEELYSSARLTLQRSVDEIEHLRSEIEHDVGLVELEQSEEVDDQPALPLRPVIERLPLVERLPAGIGQEIRRLRSQYNRLGSVNPNAPEEYAEALERHEFLTGQSVDLDQAAGTLQGVVRELNEVMQREFMSTFRAVAREFKDKFTILFGGGTAQLKLSEPDDPMNSGIEIMVRPPGKRTQALPLLSGGERSLTAAALLLSILKVSPPPFCILDEVDAALDEANVDRFRSALREAAQDSQFVIITHNRGTIEVADTIYGISMGSDSTSQALSLHLEDFDGRRRLVPDQEGG